MNCRTCNRLLTPTEEWFFTNRCEDCELSEVQRIEDWRDGKDDPELDALYGEQPSFH